MTQSAENDAPCGTCFRSGWYGSRTGEHHRHCDCGRPCNACPTAENDVEAVWEFARQFARRSGDSHSCECVSCRAYRAVQACVIPPESGQGES